MCPKCGGRYGGYVTKKVGEQIIVTDIWRCDCDSNGGHGGLIEWLPGNPNPTMKPKERRPVGRCGFVGDVGNE